MYFCPKCNYSFDIAKSIKTTTERKPLDSPRELFKRFKAKKNLANYVATFSKKELTDHAIYVKLSDDEKESLDIVFNKTVAFGGIEFKCVNCNYRKPINKTISLYQLNISSTFKINKSIEDNKLLAMNPIYPRTKDYTCKNTNCITHADVASKEAVYYRDKDSYETNYLCIKCYNSWNV
jgi:DNA-directed RNA polymerase subunit M/transcription elongation factor TFIIS